VFREDNLGLGAKTGSQRDNNHGLEILQGVLGRLNGKSSEVLEKEEKARRDVKCALYAEQRWGSLRFMHGGVLTGNTTLEVTSTPLEELPDVSEGEAGPAPSGGSESIPNATFPEEADNRKALRRKEKKEKREKKEKKLKKSQKERRADAEDLADPDTQNEASEKAAKKERKRQKALQRQKEATESEGASEKEAVVKTESTPRSSGSNTPSSRFHVRQRYIQHKRMAMMDAKALSEVRINTHFCLQTP
jgi:Pin2-interacting protein X1